MPSLSTSLPHSLILCFFFATSISFANSLWLLRGFHRSKFVRKLNFNRDVMHIHTTYVRACACAQCTKTLIKYVFGWENINWIGWQVQPMPLTNIAWMALKWKYLGHCFECRDKVKIHTQFEDGNTLTQIQREITEWVHFQFSLFFLFTSKTKTTKENEDCVAGETIRIPRTIILFELSAPNSPTWFNGNLERERMCEFQANEIFV